MLNSWEKSEHHSQLAELKRKSLLFSIRYGVICNLSCNLSAIYLQFMLLTDTSFLPFQVCRFSHEQVLNLGKYSFFICWDDFILLMWIALRNSNCLNQSWISGIKPHWLQDTLSILLVKFASICLRNCVCVFVRDFGMYMCVLFHFIL